MESENVPHGDDGQDDEPEGLHYLLPEDTIRRADLIRRTKEITYRSLNPTR